MSATRKKVQVHLHRHNPGGGDELFLVLRRPEHRGGVWQAVTGNMDPGEEPAACAVRETWEETGIERLDDCRKVLEIDFEKKGEWFHEFVFVALVDTDAIRLSDEHVEYRWLPYTEARSLLHFGSNRDGLDHAWSALDAGGTH